MTISELVKSREEISWRDMFIKEMNIRKKSTFYGARFSSSSVNLVYENR